MLWVAGRLGRGDGGDLGVGDHGEAGGGHGRRRATLVAPVNPVPVMVTVVPRRSVPEVGEMAVTVGV